ncbi:MAG: IgGFc-binding protein [Myxococcota bacterium]
MVARLCLLAAALAGCAENSFGVETAPPLDAGGGDPCEPGSARCGEAGAVERCGDGGLWESAGACAGGRICQDGACVFPPVCRAGERVCQDRDVAECLPDGSGFTDLETCPPDAVCEGGTCLHLCTRAEATKSFIACEFYSYALDNPEVTTGYSIIAANPNVDLPAPALVTVDTRSGDGWSAVGTMSVAPGAIENMNLTPRSIANSGVEPAAYRITSSLPILLYQLNGYSYLGGGGSSSGATLLFPKPALGLDHYGLTLPQGSQAGCSDFYGGSDGTCRGDLVVVATEDDTTLTVRASGSITAGGDVPALARGDSWETTLDAGDVLQLATDAPESDLTGTFVRSDKPIAFFGAHEASSPGGTYAWDHFEEQLPPVEAWGKQYVAAKIVPTENPGAAPIWRIVASEDGTTLTFDPGSGASGLPTAPIVLDAGDWYETRTNGHFFVEASAGVLVAQFVTADTDMVVMPPVEQYLPEYYFTNFAGGEVTGTLTVVRPSGATITLDDGPWSATWSDAGGGFEVAQAVSLVGNHRLSGSSSPDKPAPPAILLRGNGGGCTFSYVGGLNLEIINAPD